MIRRRDRSSGPAAALLLAKLARSEPLSRRCVC